VPPRLRTWGPFGILLALSTLLALGFAWVTPVGGAPDEGAHLRYVQILAAERRLPVLNLEHRRSVGPADQEYEAHQPPLYYLLAVPFHQAGQALAGPTGAGQGCRLLSILIGVAGTVLVWRLAGEVAPGRPALAFAAAAFAALLPMRLAVMASATNDGLAELLSTAALIQMVRLVRRLPGATSGADPVPRKRQDPGAQEPTPAPPNRAPLLLGLFLGLGLLTKATAILLLPPALLALYLGSGMREAEADRAAALRRFLAGGVVVAAAVAVLSGWWFARNHVLYGDPLAQRMFTDYFADTPQMSDFRQPPFNLTYGEYWSRLVLPTTVATFWGAFGHLNQPDLFMGNYVPGQVPPPWDGVVRLLEPLWPVWDSGGRVYIPYRSWVYPLLIVATGFAVLGGLVGRLRGRRTAPGAAPGAVLVLGAHALFVVAAFMNFNATYFQGQGRYLLPAIGAISLALAAGWRGWGSPAAEERAPGGLGWGVAAAMTGLALYALFGVAAPGFAGAGS
jgi:4-amino-4-deoxy-L-arabinose transferase-like glycosyltransferase